MGAEPPATHISKPTLYAQDLSLDVDISTLKQTFEEVLGTLAGIRISFLSKGKKRPLCRTARIDFVDITEAQKAFALANLRPIPNISPPQIIKLSISSNTLLPDPQGNPRLVKTSSHFTSAELYTLIRPFGDLAAVRVDSDLGATVQFWTEDDAKAAEVAVNNASSRLPKFALQAFDPRKLFCTNPLVLNICLDDSAYVIHKRGGRSKCYGFVSFSTTEEAAYAIRHHNQTNWLSKTIVVRYSELKTAIETQPEPNICRDESIPEPISPFLSDTPTCHNDDSTTSLNDPPTSHLKAESSQGLLTETLLKNIIYFNEQLAKATESHQLEIRSMKENMKMLERERDELKTVKVAAEKESEERAVRQQVEVDCLRAENKSSKERYEAMESQYTLLSNTFEAQCATMIGEKEDLQRQLEQVEHDRDDWRRNFEVSESRCKILELDRPLWNEVKRQKEKEKEEFQRAEEALKKEVKELERRLREMNEREKEWEKAKMKQQDEEAARKARDEEARKKREAELAEKARQTAWKAAAIAESERCRKRDMRYHCSLRIWDNRVALERFNLLITEFETLRFSESQPVMLANVPWPVLCPFFYDANQSLTFRAEDITWEAVEKFFAYVRRTYSVGQYNKLVERVHRLFHPDKWGSRRLLDTVQDTDLRKSLQSAGNIVAQAMTPIWRRSKDEV
ncbi:hypothetical protein C0995_002985 [Termitomyces sp. Mi166|nr:hypothetical protein C0995_002985 [Termitomyces sp. Mi166\